MNFLGLGFSLGAQDKGLAAAIKQTTSGLTDISRSVVDIGLASTKWALKPPDFKPALGLVNSLSNDVTTTTTALEAYGVAADKTTSASLAGLNLTEKQFKKAQGSITSLAYGMNVPVESVTKSFVALKQANVDVTKVGFKSLKQFQQVVEVTGVDSTKLASALGKMNHQMGMTPEMTADVLKSVAALGKKFNIGRESISLMNDTVEMLNENSNLLPQNWGPDKMSKFIKGTTIVAGALTKVGFSADEAIAASKGLSQALLKGRAGMAGLYSGLEDDIPAITDVLTQNLGSIDEAVKMLEQSPDDFMAGMGKLVDDVQNMNLDSDSMNRFRIQMEKQFGPAAMAVFTKKGFGQIGPAIKEAQQPIKDQEKALDDLAKKHRTGLQHADEFARVQTRIATELKQVNGVMKDKEYLVKYTEQSNKFLATAQELGNKGGPLGKITTLMIDFKNRGVGGALAAQTEWGFAVAQGVQLMQPMLQYLPMLTMAFKALASPIGLVAAGIAGLVFLFKDLGKGDKSIVRPFIERIKKEAPAFFDKIKEVFSQVGAAILKVLKMIDWAAVGQAVIKAFTWVFDGIFTVIEMIDWARVGNFLGAALGRVVEFAFDLAFKAIDLIGKMIDWVTALDWGKIGHTIGPVFAGIFAVALDAVVTVVKRLPEIFMMIVDFVIGALSGIEDALKAKFPEWATAIEGLFLVLKLIAIPILVAVAGHFMLLAVRAVYSATTSALAWTKASLEIAANLGMIVFLIVKIIARYLAMGAAAVIQGALTVASWAAQATASAAAGIIIAGVGAVIIAQFIAQKVAAVAWAAVMAAQWLIAFFPIAAVIAAVVGLGLVIYKFGSEIKSFLGGVWNAIKSAVAAPFKAIGKLITAPIETIKSAWSAVTGFFGGIGSAIKGAFSSAASWIGDKLGGAWKAVTGIFSGSEGPTVSEIVNDQMAEVKAKTEQIGKDLAKTSSDAIQGVKDTSSGTTGNVINALLDAGKQTIGAAKIIATEVGNFVSMTDVHLQKAGAIVFPKLSGDPLLDVAEKYGKVHDKISELQEKQRSGMKLSVRESEQLTKLFEQAEQLDADAMEQFGKSAASVMTGARSASDAFKKLGENMTNMSIEERDAMKEQIDLSASRYAKEYLDIARRKKILDEDADRNFARLVREKTQAGEAFDEDVLREQSRNAQLDSLYAAQMDNLLRNQDVTIAKLAAQADELSKGYKGAATTLNMQMSIVNKETVKDWDKWNKAIETTSSVMVTRFKAASKTAAGTFAPGGEAGKAVAAGFDQLDQRFADTMRKLKESGKVGPELKKAMDEATAIFEKQQWTLRNKAKELRDFVGDPKLLASAVESFKSMSNEAGKAVDAKNKQISKSTEVVTEGFKLGANEVAESTARIAVIKPAEFKRGIGIIRDETINFLKKLDSEGVKLIKDIEANIKKFFDSSKKGWNDQEALIKTFSEKAAMHIQTYWTKAIDEADRAVSAFTTMSKSIDAGLTAMAKSINLMDLLASPTQIEAWAAAVVSALANAFRGGAAADAMISAAYTEALTKASEIAHQADAARPDVDGAKVPKNTSASMQATLSLERSINHPAWAEDKEGPIPSTLKLMNENLTNLLAAMTDFAQGKPVTPPPAAPGLRRR